ncbi:MAG: pantothenate kinase [Candidatus Omnitrophica bacterium CG11_big_fil_rev_8_21_14_0_20_42_13]|uniref:Type III pantothenate kinase n=1 Tax=Candidatus Ghiorseimicrobium undicola TaxID=1974746 RepID=A0A2H0LVS8_9BACT|nr:MAG: pantothenate kinase [Candidatus Omnitrophica bacterium CG11_big_fil_rev_8_21_14_0_20_42_13]
MKRLAIDIGNTNISFGIFSGEKGGRPQRTFNIATKKYTSSKLKTALAKNMIKNIIICSVVPEATRRLKKDLKNIFKINPSVVGRNIKVPIDNLYRKPAQVGQDRLVNAYAGVIFYGAPLIVVDFGTAITFDVISRNKEYLGGNIFPGLNISLDALYERTALLPKIKLEKPKELIGGDTKQSILSGIIYGVAALTDNMCERVKKIIGKQAKVLATGGSADLIRKYCRQIDMIDQSLTLKGLNALLGNPS